MLATAELERCVKTLGFRGALVNGFSQIAGVSAPAYYDLPQYWPFWAKVEELGVPFYLHPRNPLPEDCRIYDGHPWLLGPTWAFGQETAVHALRLIGSGLFDAYPRLQIVLGHMGEGLPYSMWRIDHRNGWVKAPARHKAKRKIRDYFNSNFYLTTSGNFRTQTLIDAILEIGADRRLALRECGPRRGLVRCRQHQRDRQAQDRTRQCGEAVQARSAGHCAGLQPSRRISGLTKQQSNQG